MILDYASVSGGAKTISDSFNKDILEDQNHKWLFVTSQRNAFEARNIRNIQVKNIKKSLLHRIYFEWKILKKIVNIYKPDLIISLQNFRMKGFKGKQVVYLHQSIPFANFKVKKSDSKTENIKQLILKFVLKKDVKKADLLIVQSEFMRKIVQPYNENIIVCLPRIFDSEAKIHENIKNFIYPTNSQNYKRLDILIHVSKVLKMNNINSNIKITLDGNETKTIRKYSEVIRKENLNVHFIGKKNINEIYKLYKENNLLFTSEIESLGLPLIEGMHFGAKILAFETEISKEILNDYKYSYIFNDKNIKQKISNFYETNNQKCIGFNVKGENIYLKLKEMNIIN